MLYFQAFYFPRSTILKPGDWHWYNAQNLFRFHHFTCTHLCVCALSHVCVVLCNFVICVDSHNHQHNQDSGLYHHHKALWFLSFSNHIHYFGKILYCYKYLLLMGRFRFSISSGFNFVGFFFFGFALYFFLPIFLLKYN